MMKTIFLKIMTSYNYLFNLNKHLLVDNNNKINV